MHSVNDLNNIYIAGLLHDMGKYIQKYAGRKFKHHVASQLFVLQNPKICADGDVDVIASMCAHHHKDYSLPSVDSVLSPGQKISSALLKKAEDNNQISNKDFDKILQLADAFSASSDRASETDGNNGENSPYAPLRSIIGQVYGENLAVRHNDSYEVYEYTAQDEKTETINSLDPDFKFHIEKSFENFMNDISTVESADDIDGLLRRYWTTVNANTWKPEGSSLGNTTTSLYDHSKTTAAIAACLYINMINGRDLPSFKAESADIDVLHIVSTSDDMPLLIDELLEHIGLKLPNILGCTETESFIMIPNSITDKAESFIKEYNRQAYIEDGHTIDYDIASNWQFKNCRKPLAERFDKHFSGILQVILTEKPGVDEEYSGYQRKHLKDAYICGYAINHYKVVMDQVLTQNDSISKFSTALRIFEMFSTDVEQYLTSMKCEILSLNFERCIYAVFDNNIHEIEQGIHKIFCKYTADITGISFAAIKYNRYSDSMGLVNKELERLLALKTDLNSESAKHTTVLIGSKRFRISQVAKYNSLFKEIQGLKKSTVHKMCRIFNDVLQFENPEHLVAISRLQYLINQTRNNEENRAELAFMQKCMDRFNKWDKASSSDLEIYYEALKANRKQENNI